MTDMDFKLVRRAASPPGHKYAIGDTITDPAHIEKIMADPHLTKSFVRVALTEEEKEALAPPAPTAPEAAPAPEPPLGDPAE